MVTKRNYTFATILILLSLTFSMFTYGDKSEKNSEDEVLAEFEYGGDKHFVTLEELEQEISELPKYKQSKYSDLEGKKEYLTLMAESRLLLEIARDQELDKDPEIMKKVEEYLHQLMVEKLTEQEVDSKVEVTEEDLKQYYEEHKEDYVEPEQVRVFCICLDKEDLAKKVFKQINEEGKKVEDLAKELADDRRLVGPGSNPRNPGDTGFFSRNVSEAWKPFVDAAFDLEVGEMYSEIMGLDVQDTKYYLIFRKEEYKPERQKEFDEVRKKVERKVEKQKKKERMDEWVSKIRSEAKLQEYHDKIPVPPEEEKTEETGAATEEEESKSSETTEKSEPENQEQ